MTQSRHLHANGSEDSGSRCPGARLARKGCSRLMVHQSSAGGVIGVWLLDLRCDIVLADLVIPSQLPPVPLRENPQKHLPATKLPPLS